MTKKQPTLIAVCIGSSVLAGIVGAVLIALGVDSAFEIGLGSGLVAMILSSIGLFAGRREARLANAPDVLSMAPEVRPLAVAVMAALFLLVIILPNHGPSAPSPQIPDASMTVAAYAKHLPDVIDVYRKDVSGAPVAADESSQFFYVEMNAHGEDPLVEAVSNMESVLSREVHANQIATYTNFNIHDVRTSSAIGLLTVTFAGKDLANIDWKQIRDADLLNHAVQVVFDDFDGFGENVVTNYCRLNGGAAPAFCQQVEARKLVLADMSRGIFPKDSD